MLGTGFLCSVYDTVPNVFCTVPTPTADDGGIMPERAVCRMFFRQTMPQFFCGISPAGPSESALLLTRSVRSNKALLLEEVTRP